MVWRRKSSLVYPKQQIWFALELVSLTIGFVVICGFLLFVPPFSDWFSAPISSEDLFSDLLQVVWTKWPMVLLAFGVLLVFGLLMSHRLWGALIRLNNVLNQWKEKGNRHSRVVFRKYDYLCTAEDMLNDFLDSQENLWKEVESLAQQIDRASEAKDFEKVSQQTKELLRFFEKKGS